MDRRLVARRHGTGTATHAEALRQTACDMGLSLVSLVDRATPAEPPPGRLWRWAAAFSPAAVSAKPHPEGLFARDVFRRAQVHFDAYGRYLRLHAAAPPAVMHWTYPMPLRLAGVPNLYCVHDLIPLLQPALTPMPQTRSRRLLARLQQEAAHLVTGSETSRREIVANLGWPSDRVTNVYYRVDPPGWTAAQAADAVRQATDAAGLARDDYFLHIGTVERRKNIARLVEAYRLSGSCRALVLAGPDGWQAERELAAAADLILPPGAPARSAAGRPRILRLGWTGRQDLQGLLCGATALLAPSLAEGFGLPAVEAMAVGTPVLTSSMGAPAEVAGPAALLVDPEDVGQMAQGIAALEADEGLRARLAEAGRHRAAMFSGSAYAARLGPLYAEVLARWNRG